MRLRLKCRGGWAQRASSNSFFFDGVMQTCCLVSWPMQSLPRPLFTRLKPTKRTF